MKRFARVLMLGVMLLTSLQCLLPVQAADKTVDVILHKIALPEGKLPPVPIENDGTDSGKAADLLKDYEGLNGVTFEVYDVSKSFYDLRKNGATVKEAQATLSQLPDNQLGTAVATKVTENIGGEDGTAIFKLDDKTMLEGEEKDSVYLFRETQTPESVIKTAENMVVVLPVFSGDTLLDTIHLYPKNELAEEEDPPTLEKTILNEQASYELGEVIDYQTNVDIPKNLSKYTKFIVSDQADKHLVLQTNSIQVKAGGTVLNAGVDYQVATGKNNFSLNFDLAVLSDFAGEKLTVDYQMMLNSLPENVEQALVNTATLETDIDLLKDNEEIYTGGKTFVKIDLEDETLRLNDAKFVVQNVAGHYLQQVGSGYQWTEEMADPVILQSGEQGKFQIKGLKYGNYYLKEIEAPEGYVLNQEKIPFKVEKNSTTSALNVVNQKITEEREGLPSTGGGSSTLNTPTATRSVASGGSSSAKRLPSTNELINQGFIIVGLLLIGMVLIIKKNRRKGEK